MRNAWVVLLAASLGASAVRAAPPEYSSDPFEDDDFIDPPLILDTAHPTKGRFEAGLFFSASAIDKYTTHNGFMLDVSYHFLETLGVGLNFGYYHGELTNIVTSERGIIGNKMKNCVSNAALCDDLDPNVPDYRQITGVLSLVGMWAPLYGKINLVSELDGNLQLYMLAGGGINGTRIPTAVANATRSGPADFTVLNTGFGEGGIFDGLKGHFVAGVGVRLFLLSWLNVRGEFRMLIYGDEFDFDGNGTADGYASLFSFGQVGVGFVPF